MPALAIFGITLARHMGLFLGYRFNGNTGASKKNITLPNPLLSRSAFGNDRSFDEGCSGDFATGRSGDGINENAVPWLAKNYCKNCRAIQNHLGRPFSSYSKSPWSTNGVFGRASPRLAMAVRAACTASRLRRRRTWFRQFRLQALGPACELRDA